jgi:O-antigen ligase
MSSSIAVLFYLVVGLVLLRWSKKPKESSVLWVPAIWLIIISSRLVSQWLGLVPMTAATAFEEGSPLDRIIYLSLMVLALRILIRRRVNWNELFTRNLSLVVFLLFALVSVVWSDFPYVAFKRWVRDFGLYAMVLVVLSDSNPLIAISAVLRRFSYVLLFASFFLVKYHPEIAIAYDAWSGLPEYTGATTSKNMLGVVCLISGLFYFWDFLERWSERKTKEGRRALFANSVLIYITIRLLLLSHSATSQACLGLGCFVIVIVRSKWAKAYPRTVAAAIPCVLATYAILEFVFDFSVIVAGFLGRDATLHGRTEIWDVVLRHQTNPLFGVGYQTFWMGERMVQVLRSLNAPFLNEAHNGYIEVYLSLGFVGVALLIIFLISSWRRVSKELIVSSHFASFGVALFMVTVFYNFTEAAFGSTLLWCMLLLCVIVVPPPKRVPSWSMDRLNNRRTAEPLYQPHQPNSALSRIPAGTRVGSMRRT